VCQAQEDYVGVGVALEHALVLAEPQGFVRSFVDEGAPMVALLTQISHGDSSVTSYAARLLLAFPNAELYGLGFEIDTGSTQNSKLKTQNFLAEPLTARELEILRLIGDGHSNQAIADRLVVAVSTIKKHVNNIYGKLDVRSRTQALVRARELSLI
jgi:LuxR family transcriptional regulator, maltose regulon positive regulatory protein